MNVQYYVVVREYSGVTARKTLWEVLTRRMLKDEAERWLDFEKSRPRQDKYKQIFIVPIPEGFIP